MNQVYADVCVETEAVQDVATLYLTAGVSTYALDSRVSRIKQMYVTPSGEQQSRPLVPTSVEQILEWSASNGATSSNQGSVTHFALVGIQNILVYPTPAADDTITLFYVMLPTALAGATDVPIIQEPYVTECLVSGASYKAAVFLKDPDAELFKRDYEQAKRNLRGHLRRRHGSMTQQFRLTRDLTPAPHDPSTDVRVW